ncbi:MAG: NAD(P)H-dependent oxidoreductase [Candidatus Micrarchaeota archaeon]
MTKLNKQKIGWIMKILGINASQRKDGNSYQLLKSAFEGIKEEDKSIETELYRSTKKTWIAYTQPIEIKPEKQNRKNLVG